MANGVGEDVFLLLPRVLLEGGASKSGLGAEALGLLAKNAYWNVQAERGGELSRIMLPIRGRPPLIWN